MELKLPFGIKDHNLVEVSQVDRGLECGCVCPACGHKLIARKSEKTVHHFAHHKTAECFGGLETALHMAAKDILERHMRIRIPRVIARIGSGNVAELVQLYQEQILQFDKVYLEKRLNEIIPDIVVEINGKPFFIEIAVTHIIDDVKKEKLNRLNISTLEIDLSKIDRQITLNELETILIEGLENKRWIFNAKQLAFLNEIRKLGKEYKVVMHGMATHTETCPLPARVWKGKPYANLIDDCFDCQYFFDSRAGGGNSHSHITCIGHAKTQINDIISRHKKS